MQPLYLLSLAVLCIGFASLPAQQRQVKEKSEGPIKVEITGMLVQSGDEKGPWIIKISPLAGGEFSWPVSFQDTKEGSGDLERKAQRLRAKTVVVTGELVHIPSSTIKANPLSTLPPTHLPSFTTVVVRDIQEAKK